MHEPSIPKQRAELKSKEKVINHFLGQGHCNWRKTPGSCYLSWKCDTPGLSVSNMDLLVVFG